MHFGFINVSATHVAILRVAKTLIPLNFQEFFILANFANNLIVISVFNKVFGLFVLSDITFSELIFFRLRD
jgi:hypothetical protein